MELFVNQNWVANFTNFIYFGSPTFPPFILVFHHQLGQCSRFSSCISSCILDFIFLFIYFSWFFMGSKVSNNKHIGYKKLIKIIFYFLKHFRGALGIHKTETTKHEALISLPLHTKFLISYWMKFMSSYRFQHIKKGASVNSRRYMITLNI
jgi:hypothetical protein